MYDRDEATIRIGHGFDVHPFSTETSDRSLVLGGVTFDGYQGLVGHSDADAIAHACTDAVLGAAGLDDIGTLFPDTRDDLEGANSVALLAEAMSEVWSAGWEVVNIDCTVVLDAPKIRDHRKAMEANLSAAVEAPVTVKGKRTEGMGGLQGGVHAMAVALVRRRG